MQTVDSAAFEFAIGQIDKGNIFEKFVFDFLGKVLSYEFLPAGGIHDRGIDGLEHFFHRKGFERNVYQVSIQKNCQAKIKNTCEALKKNKVRYNALYFVTNQPFSGKDVVTDLLYEQYHKPIQVYDLKWLSSHANDSEGAVRSFRTFVSSYLHEFQQPGKAYVVSDLVTDPRLYVFLRQQRDSSKSQSDLRVILADTLILFSLENTDPDKGQFCNETEIRRRIAEHLNFDPKLLYDLITKRLLQLQKKPRRIRFHKPAGGYCLPFETRAGIVDRNLKDAALEVQFEREAGERLVQFLAYSDYENGNFGVLLKKILNRLFYQQGLEFASFVLKGENPEAFEKDLPDIISTIVDESKGVSNRDILKSVLLSTIRDIVYNGSIGEKLYLEKLSSTYMTLFLLQCDPKIATFFGSMAKQLKVYVCTSIIIPALSEFYLESPNRRHWNLLKGAQLAGVTLIVNETIMNELVAHFNMILNVYKEHYQDRENFYLADDEVLFVDEIMIRSYFYSKATGHVGNFHDFIDTFISPDLQTAQEDLLELLGDEFGISFVSDDTLHVALQESEVETLSSALQKHKGNIAKARSDSRLILTIFAIRASQNEMQEGGILGYKTWWLSKDTTTHRAVSEVFPQDKYPVSCYLRPDFLSNYIALAPSLRDVNSAYSHIFPNLVGVNLSSHLPAEVIDLVHKRISEHKGRPPGRLKGMLKRLGHQLRTDRSFQTKGYVEHYLDELMRETA